MRFASRFLLLLFLTICSAQIQIRTPLLSQEQDRFRQAIRLERIGELEAAETIYLELLEVNPKDTRVFLQIKAMYRKQQRYDEVRALLLKRIDIFKRDLQSHVELGEIFVLTNEKDRAKQYWETLRLQFSETRSIYFMLIQIYLKYGLDQELDKLVSSGRHTFSDPSFLSLELGNIHMRNLDYTAATEQYIIYASYQPKQIRTASVQILRMSDMEESHEKIEAVLLDYITFDEHTVRSLYSNFLFKLQRYSKAYDQHKALGISEQTDLDRWLRFSENLRKERQLDFALMAYTYTLNNLNNPLFQITDIVRKRATGKALYGLALTYELQIAPRQTWTPLVKYFPGNMFFEDHLVTLQSIKIKPLEDTFALYDSILTTLPSTTFPPQVHYRLGEIKYKITRDFDGAMKSFSEAASSTKDAQLNLQSNLRLADVLTAKGDFDSAIKHLKKILESNKSNEDNQTLKFKLCQIQFLHGDIDKTLRDLDELISNLDLKDPLFNDTLELKGFIEENYVQGDQIAKDAFQGYVLAESLLRQGKRAEAKSFFRSVAEAYPGAPVVDKATFRRAQLTLELGDHIKALQHLSTIQESPMGDWATMMTGEVYDRLILDKEEAARWYFKVLDDYPESLLVEPVRYRLREITNDGEL